MPLTRRELLAMAGAAAAGLCVAGPAGAAHPPHHPPNGKHKAYRRSAHGRRACKAVKIRNANLRYKTKSAADDPAHPGDTSVIVPVDISQAVFMQWFAHGAHVVDLRKLRAAR
jgi:hypothetical protein